MICDGRGCSVIAHLNCYFSAGSQDANDATTDIEHWHCENCGGLPRHMHPRPRAAKRARVSFDPVLPSPMATTSDQAVPTTHLSGGWGGHWPIRTAMPPPANGKGKEAMEPPHSSERGGGDANSAPSRHRPITRRDRESLDCDMLGRPNTELSTPRRHPVMTGDVPIAQPPRNKRSPKAKKQHNWSKNGHGGHQRREFKNQGWQSSGPHPSDPSL